MRGCSRDEFYCGTLLGGCGKRLTPKRNTEKKCHFAHRPPVHCRRTANGESSADHLYIGRALAQWLARQNHRKARRRTGRWGTGRAGPWTSGLLACPPCTGTWRTPSVGNSPFPRQSCALSGSSMSCGSTACVSAADFLGARCILHEQRPPSRPTVIGTAL
ncbi:competence protein CoiA family protein [Streptomyces ossamyceticus]|uniref:competence protein CoiA family protein n=1 Tax=Streptomyces ossamyceticus TaxID=249581 RepID=UPI003418C26E